VRLEQLYPLPVDEIRAQLARYPNAEDYVWVQEEPANQGAWTFITLNLLEHLDGIPVRRISRPARRARPSARPSCTTPSRPRSSRPPFPGRRDVYFTDRGIEELVERRGDETVSLEWVAERLREFLDANPSSRRRSSASHVPGAASTTTRTD
jgi:2-oxoglutarate dehydrogenase E1 component